jgi:hypothetical protein
MPPRPVPYRGVFPLIRSGKEREAFLHVALLGMTLTVTALLGYIAVCAGDEEPAITPRE